jgi:hypothetical protein
MSAIASTSGRLHSEFVRLLFLQAHRETDRFYAASGVQSAQSTSVFHFRRAAFLQQVKSKVGLTLVKATAFSDAAQDRTCTARAVVRSGHRTTARAVKKIEFFFCPFSSRFDPFPRASFHRTKTIFFSAKKKISMWKK